MTTEKRDLLDVALRVRVSAAEYRRINALADRLSVRQLDVVRAAVGIGIDALERGISGADAARIVRALERMNAE